MLHQSRTTVSRAHVSLSCSGVVCFMVNCVVALCLASHGVDSAIVINGNATGYEFDGHGGLSAGGTTRLLLDYEEPYRSEILDYLFKPNFGASLAVLKLEIGGDTQSTDGTEPSHMHSRDDLGCTRGYEGWLASEAKKRNPDIKIWSLSWGVPGWIGNGTYYSDDNMHYQIQWLKCLRDAYGVDSDYLGLWNERPQGSESYVITLRNALDNSGFSHVGITMEATWQPLINSVLTNATFNASIAAATKHYPCNETSAAAIQAHKKFWAGEDTPTHTGNWSGAGCWGRKLNQHFITMNATSAISWAVVWSAYPGEGQQFLANAFINATEPWSGHYDTLPVLWINAHWHQFVDPGWEFLQVGPSGGSNMLPGGHGSYVTLVKPTGHASMVSGSTVQDPAPTFTMIIETLQGSCGVGNCNNVINTTTTPQDLEFSLQGALASATQLHQWCSTAQSVFAYKGVVKISAGGLLRLTMDADAICTLTTLSPATNGSKGQHPNPPTSARFPTSHSDNFSSYGEDTLAWGFGDVYGSFAVRADKTRGGDGKNSLTQVATGKPTGWAPTNYDPLTFIGDFMWSDVSVNVSTFINHSAVLGQYVRVCAGCASTSSRVLAYGCPDACCFNLSWTGNWSVGAGDKAVVGTIPNFKDEWHQVHMSLTGTLLEATVDGVPVARTNATCPASHTGMVGVGCGSYHYCALREFSVQGSI